MTSSDIPTPVQLADLMSSFACPLGYHQCTDIHLLGSCQEQANTSFWPPRHLSLTPMHLWHAAGSHVHMHHIAELGMQSAGFLAMVAKISCMPDLHDLKGFVSQHCPDPARAGIDLVVVSTSSRANLYCMPWHLASIHLPAFPGHMLLGSWHRSCRRCNMHVHACTCCCCIYQPAISFMQ